MNRNISIFSTGLLFWGPSAQILASPVVSANSLSMPVLSGVWIQAQQMHGSSVCLAAPSKSCSNDPVDSYFLNAYTGDDSNV